MSYLFFLSQQLYGFINKKLHNVSQRIYIFEYDNEFIFCIM